MSVPFWRPQNELEEEIVSLQPELNFIFGDLTDQVNEEERLQNVHKPEFQQGNPLSIMRTVAEIAGTTPFGESVKLSDWDTCATAEQEITAMIRHFGMCSSKDEPLLMKTKAAHKTLTDKTKTSQKKSNSKQMSPTLLGDEDFKITTTRMKNKEIKAAEKTSKNTSTIPSTALKIEKESTNESMSKVQNYTNNLELKERVANEAEVDTTLKPTKNKDFHGLKLYTPTELYNRKKNLTPTNNSK